MKTNKALLHYISIAVLFIFISLCIATTGSTATDKAINSVLNTPVETSTTADSNGIKTDKLIITRLDEQFVWTESGPYDEENNFNGPVESIKWLWSTDSLVSIRKTENYYSVNGQRHGTSYITKIITPPGNITRDTVCYKMGEKIECDEDGRTRDNDTTAYEILVNRYPHWYDLLTFRYEDEFIRSYMDTLEQIIATYDVDITDFEDSYEDALDELENSAFESLTLDNLDYSILHLLDLMNHCVFRQAIFDRYLKEFNSIYLVIAEFYPHFPQLIQEEFDISEPAFENYCTVFDSLLNSYGPLDTENYLFPDSLDTRIFRAPQYIDSLGSAELQDANIAVAFLSIEEFYEDADILMKCQREAYFLNNEYVDLPTVTTFIKAQNSDTEAEIEGYVINDGGSEVTKRGILWAQHYNPTMEDSQENAGNGTGQFSVTLSSLTPGETYFVRSFATNSAGTSYGNCVDFVAQQVTGIKDLVFTNNSLLLFPNPASTFVNIQLTNKVSSLFILDINGKIVQTLSGNLDVDKQIRMDISSLPDGVYVCAANYANRSPLQKKFLVLH